MVYDAERQSILILSGYTAWQNVVLRFTWSGLGWDDTSVTLPSPVIGIRDFALSPDGRQLLALSTSNVVGDLGNRRKLIKLDADTLDILDFTPALVDSETFESIAFANDGNAIIAVSDNAYLPTFRFYRSHILYDTFEMVSGTLPDRNNVYLGAAQNGNRIIFANAPGGITPPPGSNIVNYYTASDNTITASSLESSFSYDLSLSRSGTKAILGRQVIDENFNVLGDLPICAYGSAVISPDGTRAYGYCSSPSRLYSYDLTMQDVNGNYIEIANLPISDAGFNKVSMTISPDGNTLFIVGGTNLIISPVP